ncbi:hypothetical protein OE810_13250 [Rhodobacteraceae bacterium XHP0102]|nr:hypothetical protein [Rhodobacteraceae bacterium XHP0102]
MLECDVILDYLWSHDYKNEVIYRVRLQRRMKFESVPQIGSVIDLRLLDDPVWRDAFRVKDIGITMDSLYRQRDTTVFAERGPNIILSELGRFSASADDLDILKGWVSVCKENGWSVKIEEPLGGKSELFVPVID